MVRVVAMALDIGSTALAQSASLSALLGMSEDMPPHPIGNLMHLAGLAVLDKIYKGGIIPGPTGQAEDGRPKLPVTIENASTD